MKIKDSKFWKKVNRNRSEFACWEWLGAKDKDGYGRVFRKRALKVHRYAFFLYHGRWPDGLCGHVCDNKSCVRPDHLFEGDYVPSPDSANEFDYFESVAEEIKTRYVPKSKVNGMAALAKEYGLGLNIVRELIAGGDDVVR